MTDNSTKQFIRLESIAGLILIAVLIIALFIANSNFSDQYHNFTHTQILIGINDSILKKPLLLWVNDGLMAVFFMLLAIEIKREIIEGDLSDKKQLSLPFFCAAGGIIVPIIIYISLNYSNPAALQGWPIPTTTDIAFVLGVIALLGKRVPVELKVLLVAFSIIDDIVAVLIIAAYYTDNLSWTALSVGLSGLGLLLIGNKYNITNITFYLIIGLVIWLFVLQSGVHATLAGIAVGLTIPIKTLNNERSPGKSLEHTLHPLVTFFIIPLFVFMNGGISFTGFSLQQLAHPITLGIILGLVLGKGLGVFLFARVAIHYKLATKSTAYNYQQFLGLCCLSGIGFTMSLFFSGLAFKAGSLNIFASQGILIASLLACMLGVILFTSTNLFKFSTNKN